MECLCVHIGTYGPLRHLQRKELGKKGFVDSVYLQSWTPRLKIEFLNSQAAYPNS